MLKEGAEKFGYVGDVWTLGRICELISVKFNIQYTKQNVGLLLKKWGWTWQKPQTTAVQKNDEAAGQWLEKQWPEIKKGRN